MNKEMLLKLIENAQIDEKIYLKKFGHYLDYVYFEQVRMDSLDYDLRGQYTWVAQTEGWRSVFPMKTIHYVKFFKTLKGAKRNFIKRYIEKE